MNAKQSTFESLAELIGKEGALLLCEERGGETLYITKSIAIGDNVRRPWFEILGQSASERLNKHLGGKRVYIPMAPPELLAERNAAILQRFRQGESATVIARSLDLSPRSVNLIRARCESQSVGGAA